MTEPSEIRTSLRGTTAVRILLLIGGAALFLFISPAAASADEGASGLGGLVDTVTGTVEEATDGVTGTIDIVTDETTGTVEEVLDTAAETVEDVVETATETAEQVAGAASETVRTVVDRAAPGLTPPGDEIGGGAEPPSGHPDQAPAHDPASVRPTAIAIDEARQPLGFTGTLPANAPGREHPAATSGFQPHEPLVPADPPGAASSSAGDEPPASLRSPTQGQDLVLTTTLLLIALALAHRSRHEGGLRYSPAFLSLLERPG